MGDSAHQNLYFAYGSNIWIDQMKRRCPNSTYVGVAVLREWKWIINTKGYATIVPSKDDHVYGTIYELDPEDENILDGFEGVPGDYTKHHYDLELEGSKANPKATKINALVYIDLKRQKEGPPKEEYIYRLNMAFADGVKEGIPEEYVKKYIRPFIPPPGSN